MYIEKEEKLTSGDSSTMTWGDIPLEHTTAGISNNDPVSHFLMGLRFRDGDEVKQSYIEAKKYFESAETLGCLNAKDELGMLYVRGDGIAQCFDTARKYFMEAASHNIASACEHLGGMYYNGDGVQQSFKEAEKWFSKAQRLELQS